ncbi:hypothetical protein [Roseiconus lacunae]|uniref:hypothetical protein n=1 Tax=Roseiconus lacunae TaxID=2605694 RepID=UPI0011F301EF|nr:hypothetical protein [Roseiconus lacunae]
MKKLLGQLFVGLAGSPKRDPKYTTAMIWSQQINGPSRDEEGLAQLSKELFEYGRSVLDMEIDTLNKNREAARGLMQFNAYLCAAVFAAFKVGDRSADGFAIGAVVCWILAIALLAIAFKRQRIPFMPSVDGPYDLLTDSEDRRLHAYLTPALHTAIVELEIIINRQSSVVNASLLITAIGLGSVLGSIVFA